MDRWTDLFTMAKMRYSSSCCRA